MLCLALAYGIEPICYGIIFLVAMGAIFVGTLLIAAFPLAGCSAAFVAGLPLRPQSSRTPRSGYCATPRCQV